MRAVRWQSGWVYVRLGAVVGQVRLPMRAVRWQSGWVYGRLGALVGRGILLMRAVGKLVVVGWCWYVLESWRVGELERG